MTVSFRLGLAVLCGFSLTLQAQNGDKPGEQQRDVVPAHLIPPAPLLTPEEQLKTFRVPEGFSVEIVASEPLITTPVVMQFDAQGRAWVVEMNGYMPTIEGRGEDTPNGRIVILEDRDGDGRMDHRKVFLDGLIMPRSLLLVDGGAVVAEPPQLWWCPDRDGDDRADEKVLLASDYATQNDPKLGMKSNPEHASNGLLRALDNWVYSANHTVRYRPIGKSQWKAEPTIFRGQWGLTQDDYGRLFFNSNSDQLRADWTQSHYLARNPNLRQPFGANVQLVKDQRVWSGRVNPGVNRGYQPNQLTPEGKLATFTGACGPVVYRGDQFPEEYRGDVFLCEPTANLIRRNRILETGGELAATNAYVGGEFLTSTDERFRPVNLYNGPDGALYVVDMARGLIQHRIYLTSYLRKQIESRGLQTPVAQGRIYRIVHRSRPIARKDRLDPKAATPEILARLSHPNGWWRDTAQRLLVERQEVSVVEDLKKLCRPGASSSPLGRLHALWTLEGLGRLDLPTVDAALDDANVRVRIAALRLSEGFLEGETRGPAINAILKRAGFVPLEEQHQLILTLGQVATPAADNVIKILLMNTPASRMRFDAAISGLKGRELEFLENLANDPSCSTSKMEHAPLLASLASCVIYEGQPSRIERLLGLAAMKKAGDWQQVAILGGIDATVPPDAKDGRQTPVKAIEFAAQPKAMPLLAQIVSGQPELNAKWKRVERLWAWPGKAAAAGNAPAPVVALTAADVERVGRGKEVYTILCAPCHQPHGNGQDGLAPPLVNSEWVLGSEQRLVRIVLHGVRDAITVKGQKWELNMPTLAEAIDDQQIADVLTYIRREWGHQSEPVRLETVQRIRAETSKREDSWTEAELLKIP